MEIKNLPRDIFGITMFVTPKANEREFTRFVCVLSNLGQLKPQIFIGDLHLYVRLGILSPQSASYFAAGRASDFQVLKLETFLKTVCHLISQPVKLFNLIQSWQKRNVFVQESTFLFPLEELVSKDSFESERREYENVDYRDLSKIGI